MAAVTLLKFPGSGSAPQGHDGAADDTRFNSLGLGVAAPLTAGSYDATQAAAASGTPASALRVTGGPHTGLANAQATDLNFALARAVAFSGGGAAIPWQSVVRVQAPTYSAAAAQTIAELSTLLVEQALATGANLTAQRLSAIAVNGAISSTIRWYTGSLTAAPTRTTYLALDNATGNFDFNGAFSLSSTNDLAFTSPIVALLTLTRDASSGVGGALGPELLQFETREAATAGATIRNPGYLSFEARTWKTDEPAASTTQSFGRFGGVVDSITAATGVPTAYRMVWVNTAGTIKWSVDQDGLMAVESATLAAAPAQTNSAVRANEVPIPIGAAPGTLTSIGGATKYSGPYTTQPGPTETAVSFLVPHAMVLRNLRVRAQAAPTGASVLFTAFVNEQANTALEVDYLTTSSGTLIDDAGSITLAAGDRLSIKIVMNTGYNDNSMTDVRWSLDATRL